MTGGELAIVIAGTPRTGPAVPGTLAERPPPRRALKFGEGIHPLLSTCSRSSHVSARVLSQATGGPPGDRGRGRRGCSGPPDLTAVLALCQRPRRRVPTPSPSSAAASTP